MKLLFVTHNYPRHAGDHAGSFVARLAEGAVRRGHTAVVVAPHAPGSAREEVAGGVHIQRFRYAPDALERVAYRGDLHQRSALDPAAMLGVPAMLAAYALAVRNAVRRFRPDVVHAHWWFPGGTFAVGRGAPTVITCHGSDVRLLDRGGVLRAAGRRTLLAAHAVTCVSDFLARDVERAVPELRGRVRTIYMPIDVDRFAQAAAGDRRADPPRILFVGNLVPSKGVPVLVDAFARMRRRGVPCTLRIVGRGVDEQGLREQAAAAGVASDVEWAGFVPQDRIAAEYAAATVTVLPSRGQGEGLGLVLAEALLSGSAVVGSPAGGIPEVVLDEVTGLIARDGDADHLAAQLARLLEDTVLRARLTAAGAAHVRAAFAPDAAVDAFETVYRGAARRDGA